MARQCRLELRLKLLEGLLTGRALSLQLLLGGQACGLFGLLPVGGLRLHRTLQLRHGGRQALPGLLQLREACLCGLLPGGLLNTRLGCAGEGGFQFRLPVQRSGQLMLQRFGGQLVILLEVLLGQCRLELRLELLEGLLTGRALSLQLLLGGQVCGLGGVHRLLLLAQCFTRLPGGGFRVLPGLLASRGLLRGLRQVGARRGHRPWRLLWPGQRRLLWRAFDARQVELFLYRLRRMRLSRQRRLYLLCGGRQSFLFRRI